MGYKTLQSGDNEAIVYDLESENSILAYWSEDRMKNAIPIDMSEEECERESSLSIEKADIDKMPFKVGGKLFFSKDGKDRCGSAQYCADKKLILTAAHCVRSKETGNWAENIVFCRGYRSGDYKDKVLVHSAATKIYWIQDEKKWQWDYGFCVTREACDCGVLNYRTFTPETMESGNATAFGYPSNYYNGKNMVYVKENYQKYENECNVLRMIGNTMSNGCSGGAWTDDENNVISVNSFSNSGFPNDLFGPIFTKDFKSLAEYAKTLIY